MSEFRDFLESREDYEVALWELWEALGDLVTAIEAHLLEIASNLDGEVPYGIRQAANYSRALARAKMLHKNTESIVKETLGIKD